MTSASSVRSIVARSALFVPGDAPDKLDRCFEYGADCVIADLEDAVAPARKDTAREKVAAWLPSRPARPVWVRVNNTEVLAADIAAVVRPGLSGICVPKCSSAREVDRLDGIIEASELAAGLPTRSIAVWPLIESPAGLAAVFDLVASPRVAGLQIGEVDLVAGLGISASEDESELHPYRSLVVLASNAAGLGAPLAPASVQWRDEERYRRSSEAMARMGFGGRVCIHPRQVAIANEVFTPSAERLEWARRVVRGFDAARSAGVGVFVDDSGQMIDEAVVRIARRVILVAAASDKGATELGDEV